MGRWAPDARQRLQSAGMELLREHGYDNVSVADIAERAGLTRRTFFNHFPDKQDLLFAGAQELEDTVIRCIEQAAPDRAPFPTAIDAFSTAGQTLTPFVPFAMERRRIIDSAPALRERELTKAASLIRATEQALERRGTPPRRAHFASAVAHEVFRTAYDIWSTQPTADFEELMRSTTTDLRESLNERG